MPQYYSRPLAREIANAQSKVIVLEGARAVGKTSLVQKELGGLGYAYLSLANSSTFQQAQENIDLWVSNIERPAIIDEAQRIADLPLAIKEVVDRTSSSRPQFILTGSASINKGGLDGQDPLTRRSQRFTLFPLTQAEIEGRKGSIVDSLFELDPNRGFSTTFTKQQVLPMMRIGGFPTYVTTAKPMSDRTRGKLIQSDIVSVLGDTLLPEERIDRDKAWRLLNKILTAPGCILNVSALSNECDLSAITVTRYMSIFQRRYLIHTLQNLAVPPRKQEFARSKVHPIDTTFSIETLRKAGSDIAHDSALLGRVFESFVVNQVVPAAEWASSHTDCFYWREAGKKPKEVDLVLLREGKLVGIEVKYSTRVQKHDFSSLNTLANDDRFHRGYIIYAGSEIVRHADNMWALPVAALWEANAFLETHTNNALFTEAETLQILANQEKGDSMESADASIFLSYRHADNDHLNGKIVQYAKDLAEEYSYQYGATIDLFIDSETLGWGEVWPQELKRRIQATNFIMPAVTPRYITSENCRDEIMEFNSKLEKMPNSSILPIVWQSIDHLIDDANNDPVVSLLRERQWIEATTLRYAARESVAYQQNLETTAQQLREAIISNIEKSQRTDTEQKDETREATEEAADLLERMSAIEEESEQIQEYGNVISENLDEIAGLINQNPIPNNVSAKGMLVWSAKVAAKTQPYVDEIEKATSNLGSFWNRYYSLIAEYVRLVDEHCTNNQSATALEGIEEGTFSLMRTCTVTEDMRQTAETMQFAAALAPRLKPLAMVIGNVVKIFSTISTMSNSLLEEIAATKAKKHP